jgi:Tfp pilus tip-associated adhesin PilY1
MRSTYANTSYNTLGRAYYNAAFGANVTIAAAVTGKVFLRSSQTTDKWEFVLRDYNPAAGSGATGSVINTVTNISSPSTTAATLVTVPFTNTAYTLPLGHYLMLEIRYKPATNGNSGRFYCNTTNTSYLDVGIKLSITSSAGAGGSITGPATTPGVALVDLNSSTTYTATATTGIINTFTVDGVSVPTAVGQSTYTYNGPAVTNITANHTIDVQFQAGAGNFIVAPGAHGCITVQGWPACPGVGHPPWNGGSSFPYPTVTGTYIFDVVPDAGYGIGSVTVGGVNQAVPHGQTTLWSTVPITLSNLSSISLSATFLPYYAVTYSAGVGGTIGSADSTPVLSGDSITLDITPDPDYAILDITVDGVSVGSTTPLTLTNVNATHNVVASFQRIYTITASAGPNGAITPIGNVSVLSSSSQNFSITPNMGYRVLDVVVDGTSVGAMTAYTFTNVTTDHTIAATFIDAPLASTYCAIPAFISTPAPANVMLMLSVESPMEGAANPTVTFSGGTPASFTYNANSSGLGAYMDGKEYYGYFDNNKCYTYSGSGATGLFSPSAAAIGTNKHQCPAGTAWSGNMLNWSTMLAVDAFRKAFTGGNRTVDNPAGDTILLGAFNDGSWFPAKPTIVGSAELYMPIAGVNQTRTIERQGAGIGFGLCNAGQASCTVSSAGSGESRWPTAGANTAAVYSLRIKACDPTGGVEARCNSTTNKPEGTIQKYMDRMRFALMSYTTDGAADRDGGILREKMKWVAPLIPNGLMYHNAANAVVTCSTSAGCANPEKEINSDGTFVNNPDAAASGNSGVINYINKFAYANNAYKGLDPAGELYYEIVRYFKNLTPSVAKYCSGITEPNDGFPVYCNASKTNARGWRDPTLYSCSQNFVIAINDANPWLDKRIPGSAFKANYGGAAGYNDWCGSPSGACDVDFTDSGVPVNVEAWTNLVGDYEGFTGHLFNTAGKMYGCEVDAAGVCIGGFNSGGKSITVSKLGRIVGTPPGPAKENSYNMAGLAYYAHMTDLRPDLPHSNSLPKHNLTTFMLDTQEPQNNMLVGPMNVLWLAAKYGGFTDIDNDGKPYNGATCGGVSGSPNQYCAEWDSTNVGTPDNYFLANEGSKVEAGLNYAFSKIIATASSGTAAAVANNRSGERGANIIQAIFYPKWKETDIKWLGEVQALWYYLDPNISASGIFEDTDGDKVFNISLDNTPASDPNIAYSVKALWKAGAELHKRSAASRNVYTLLDPGNLVLTDAANAFKTTKMTTLRPLLNSAALTDPQANALIDYIRGVDSGAYRSRKVTNTTTAYGTITQEWKLGDVINSTPQIQSAIPINAYHTAYGDQSYGDFIKTAAYKAKNVVYTGANDGMLHAFRLGQVNKVIDPANKIIAEIDDTTGLGSEEWAFIPKNALPYLPNFCDSSYCHQYLVDGVPVVNDVSVNVTTSTPSVCSASNYWDCHTKEDGGATHPEAWRTVLIGSMGLGGASRDVAGNCNETLGHVPSSSDPNHNATPNLSGNTDCVKSPVVGSGLSSYFALDVTDPLAPKSMWELSDTDLPAIDKGLGFTTPGAAFVRINAMDGTGKRVPNTNGRWFAVMASGPTGSIDTSTRQFMGRSDQNLKLYVVDVNATPPFVKGYNYWVIDTGINYAFANSLSGAVMDVDRSDSTRNGFYSDDVVYITYTTALDSANWVTTPAPPAVRGDGSAQYYPTAWNKGGVLRLLTNNDPDPANWRWSFLMKDIGPITTSVGKLQSWKNKKLWVYFGEGRYFYQGDELNTSRRIYGVADPCYNTDSDTLHDINLQNTMNKVTSNNAANCPAVTLAELKDQTSDAAAATALGASDKGWYISLDAGPVTKSDGKIYGAERVVSDVTAAFNGIVFFTTFIPSTDICVSGGSTSLWAVKHNTGGTPPTGGLKGKAPMQTSTGSTPTMVDLAASFSERGKRKLGFTFSPSGIAAKGPLRLLLSPLPMRKILNIQER